MVLGFTEPKQNSFIYKKLKPHSASIDDLRKFIANENNCDERHITFFKITDYKEVGKYEVCVGGNTMIYNRMFFNFVKSTNNPDDKNYLTTCTLPSRFKTNTLWDNILFSLSLIISVFIYTYFSYYFLLFMKLGVQKLRNNN